MNNENDLTYNNSVEYILIILVMKSHYNCNDNKINEIQSNARTNFMNFTEPFKYFS